MFTPTLRCECAQPASDRLMRKWCIDLVFEQFPSGDSIIRLQTDSGNSREDFFHFKP